MNLLPCRSALVKPTLLANKNRKAGRGKIGKIRLVSRLYGSVNEAGALLTVDTSFLKETRGQTIRR